MEIIKEFIDGDNKEIRLSLLPKIQVFVYIVPTFFCKFTNFPSS